MYVLGAVRVAGAERTLLTRRQAGHPASGEEPAGERVRRVVERRAVQARLDAVPVLVEGDRVDIHPAVTGCPQLYPDRQPVGFRLVPELTEHRQATAEIGGVDGEVEITMLAGLPAG